jgi:hypothetical protein
MFKNHVYVFFLTDYFRFCAGARTFGLARLILETQREKIGHPVL